MAKTDPLQPFGRVASRYQPWGIGRVWLGSLITATILQLAYVAVVFILEPDAFIHRTTVEQSAWLSLFMVAAGIAFWSLMFAWAAARIYEFFLKRKLKRMQPPNRQAPIHNRQSPHGRS